MASLLLIPLLFLSFLGLVESTHFAYATYEFAVQKYVPYNAANPQARNYSMSHTFGYRTNFGWYSPARDPNVGDTVDPGQMFFYPLLTTSTSGLGTEFDVQLKVETKFTNDNWFLGHFNHLFITKSPYHGNHWRSYFNDCCRLSSIRDRNNDVDWTVTGILNKYSERSPVATGLPRVYVQQFFPLRYRVPFLSPSGKDVIVSLAIAPTDSTLNNRVPIDNNIPGKVFTLNKTTGTVTWTPQITGLYAVAFFVEEVCDKPAGSSPGDVPCADQGLVATPTKGSSGSRGVAAINCCSRVPLDFIFQVDPGCEGQANCVPPPYFYSPFNEFTVPEQDRVWYFNRGIEGFFNVCATVNVSLAVNDTQQTTHINVGTRPATSSWAQVGPEALRTCYLFKWAPGIADQDQYICASAFITPGYRGQPLYNQGLYCILLIIKDGVKLQAAGIIRDFRDAHPDFNVSYSDCRWCTAANNATNLITNSWVSSRLDANHKPVYAPGTPVPTSTRGTGLQTGTAQGFYDWYTTDPATTNPRNLAIPYTVILSSGASLDEAVFTFLSSTFFPIDNQGFGNEGADHNYYYTFEVNMYITYYGSLSLRAAAMDDLWIFIDDVLPANWNQHGIKPPMSNGNPYNYTIVMDTLLDHENSPLRVNETYRCDMFYANRYGVPYLLIEVPNNTLCSQLSSGKYAINLTNFASVPLVDGSVTGAVIPADGFFYVGYSGQYGPSKGTINRPAVPYGTGALNHPGLKIFDQRSQGSAVCWGTPLKALHGFIATFTWFVDNPNKRELDGFAFMLVSYPFYRGGAAGSLGYGGLQRSLVVEFDMLQTALLSDPDFTVCCGDYPIWDTAQPGWTMKPYGQVSTHAKATPVSGSYPGNSADENPATGGLVGTSSQGRIFLDFRNGTEYKTKIIYQPALDDGSTNVQLGWLWTYINKQLEPINAVQLDGVVLRNMLGGATTFCFTSGGQWVPSGSMTGSNPSGYGADIWLLDYNVLIVPTDAGSTLITKAQIIGQPEIIGASSPISPMIAGQISTVTVQAKDACGNPITVGGELDLFTCNVVKETCPGNPVPCNGTDNGDGTYTFAFRPTIAARNYLLYLSFGPTGDVRTLRGSPYRFIVDAATASIETSIAVFGQLPELYSNAGNDPFNGDLRSEGVFAARFSQYGRVVAYKMFDFANAMDVYNGGTVSGATGLVNFINGVASTEYLLIATSGSNFLPSLLGDASLNTALNGLSPAGNELRNVVPGNAYTLIARKGGVAPTCVPAPCQRRSTNGTARITTRGIDDSSISFTRNFTLVASSADANCGPWAILNSIFDDIRVPAGTLNQFTIQARDIFGNLNRLTNIQAAFQPDLVPSTNGDLTASPIHPLTGYFYYPFYSEKAGEFFMYASLNGDSGSNIRNGLGMAPFAPYRVLIDPGLANITNSYCQGPVLTTSTVGVWNTFQLVLYDRWSNAITFMNPADQISATLIWRHNKTVVTTLNTSWQDGPCGVKCVYYASFNTTIASSLTDDNQKFDINVTINGYWKICGQPDIVPGPFYPPTTTFDVGALAPTRAGTQTTFTIYTRDRFGNARRTQLATGDDLLVLFQYPVTGYVIQYAGQGQYAVAATPTKKGDNNVQVIASGTGSGDVKPAGNTTIGNQILKVIPGPAAANSTTSGISNGIIVRAGTLNEFIVTSYDKYLNLRDNTAYGIVVANASDYAFRFNEPVKGIEGMIRLKSTSTYATTGMFNFEYNATIIGTYRITVQTTPAPGAPVSQHILASPITPVYVVPACTHPPSTVFGGAGLAGGIQATETNFTMTARDIFTNIQADWRDQNLYNVTITPATTPAPNITNQATPGNFLVKYTIPNNDGTVSPNIAFTIKVCHNGLNSTTGPKCYDSWCTTFNSTSVSTNRVFNGTITVTDGFAGTPMNWFIRDIDSNGNAATGTNIVTSWLVTVTRTTPNDGVPASVAQPISIAGTEMITGPPAMVRTNVSFTPTLNIGTFRVRVFAYGIETEQSKAGISVNIGPGPVYPPNCVVSGLSATVPAGSDNAFAVALKDEWFHDITDGGLTVNANLTHSDAGVPMMPISGVHNSSNWWTFNYHINVKGLWDVSIGETVSLMAGKGPIGNNLKITVTPGVAVCDKSYVKGVTVAPAMFATAGESVTFTIVPVDTFGNPVEDASTLFTLDDVNGDADFAQAAVSSAVPPAIEIQVTYLPRKVLLPNNVLSVKIGGCELTGTVPVAGSGDTPQQTTLAVVVWPADIYPPNSQAIATVSRVEAGNELGLNLTLRDRFNNAWFSGRTQAITGFVSVPGASQPYAAITSDGAGAGKYVLTLSGQNTRQASAWDSATQSYIPDYVWEVTANGVTISGPAPLLTVPNSVVTAGPTSPSNTLPPTLVDLTSDVPQVYQVTLRDVFGNIKYQNATGDQVKFNWIQGTVLCSFNEAVSPANDSAITTVGNPVYDKDGVFNVTVLGTIVGSYTLNITVKPQYGPNGAAYVGEGGWYGSPNCGPTARLLETVNPGPASPPHSWWTINKKVFNAGEKAIIFVQARDRQFNNIGKGNTPLSLGNKTVPASPSVMLPAVGPELSTLGGYTITPRTDAMHPWIDPIFCVTNCDPTFPIAPGSIPPSGTVTDFGNSSYAFEITFWKSGNALPVVVGMLNASAPGVWVAVPWPSTLASDASVDVLPGPPQQFYPDTAGVATLLQNAGTTAAVPTSFTIYAYDKYGNPVAPDSNATFDIVMRQQVNGYEVPITATVIGGGATTFSFTSAWAGPFDLLITLHPGDGSNDITPPPAVVTIDHATCEADNPGKPYRCPDRSCVASYNLCPTTSIPAGTCGLMNPPKVTCSDGTTCRDKATDCPCPGTQVRCVTGNCAATQADCPQPNTCPSGYSLCPGTGQCRQDITKDCPSAGACPPGYVVCPSGVNCARNMSDCPVIDTSLCTAPSKLCPTGTCAATATDCPTPTTCPASKPTLCLTDGSCQLDAAHCPDQYPCFAPNTYRCPGTGLCTTGLDQCPSSTTCKPGWVKCEAGTCAPTQADCVAPIDCGYSKVRCADGSCVDNTLFCPAVPSCALTAPIRCWDGNCVTYAVECTTPQQCTTNVTCPGGSCSNTVNLCPTGTTCPTAKPVLCPDGSCQADKDSCTIIPSCPVDQPVRCPDGQSCRGARTDCPTIISCPIGASVKCADGTCALAIDKCAPATNCPADLLRCPGGECIADTTALCPTHETCPTDYGKCLDGTCRQQCPTTYQTCPAGQVTCPQAAAGVQCALDLTACPQQPTCPPGLPVRCFDASCSSTVTNCPTPPETFPNNKIPCGDGTWATSIANCPTPLTCPSATPAKCTDNTCRLTPADCSVTRLCPLDTPYLCSSGACVKNPWDPECTSSTAPCPLTKPVACSPYGSGVCAENITVCDGLAPSPLNCTGVSCTVCGVIDSVPQTYCRSGACVNDPAYCPTVGCDPSVPVKCTDGQCVAKSSLCNDENSGCPAGLLRCDQTGMCTETINNQIYDPTKGCPTNFTSGCPGGAAFCDDGSCPYQGVCPKRNGCAAYGMDQTKTKRCYDGTCVVNIADCTSNAPPEEIPQIYPGMCQPSNPYKCADGFCAKTSTACPPQLVNLDCKAPNTVQCATGACVSSALMCPPLNPVCPDGYVRCPSDASCRAHIETCPVYSKCPHRCDNGVCAPDDTYCSFDEFTGCPGGMDKCTETGECVQNLASCTPINKANGCPSTLPFKCPNGDCKALQSQCNVGPSGACPQSAPLLCADGECATLCTGGSTCPGAKPQRCADGTCAANLAECHTYNGCNGTHPYRCVDGSCASQAATAQDPESCPLTVLCSAGLQLCMDGGCVAKASLCTPLLCVPPLEYCNFGCNMNCSTQTPKCPSKSPILCASGACVASLALCGTSSTGGAANTDCTGSTPLACAQGNCVANLNECPALAAGANGVPLNGAAQGQNANAGCGAGKVMCSNGECVSWARRYACKIIASCPPLTYRWWDGSCRASKSGAPAEVDCADPNSNIRCEDGWCRDEKMGYDGCSNNKKASFLCSNRNCAENPSKCNWVASGNPSTYPRFDTSCKFGACRRLLQSSTRPDPCIPDATKQCNAMIHAGGAAELIEATVDIYKTTTIPVALNKDLVSIASLSIPSGAFYLTNGASTTSISIRAVPASRLRYAVNEIVPSRRSQYGSYLDFPITVLSVPFECVLPEEVQKDFVLNITYTAWIDLTPPMIDYKDVCLARLVELQGFSTWECLIGDRSLRNVSSIYYVHKEGAPSQEVASVFQTCSPSSAPGVVSPYNGSVYAFIFSPVPDAPKSPEGLDVVQRNIVWIILGILLGIALLILLTYCAFRLFRYREKYHTEREEADRLQEEVENMKQFGGDSGNKDDQVAMTANPLAVQLKDVQARYNEEEMKLQQAEASLRKQEGEIRAQHIDNMRDNRNKLAQELEKLKAQLAEAQAASQPKATYEEHEGPSYTGDEPVREEFDTGSTAVAPKRGKKDL